MRNWLAILLLLLTSAAHAAEVMEVAERRIYGFSESGAHFAFAEYGVDAAGFPYANIDLGIPEKSIRVRLDKRSATPGEALRKAEERAVALFRQYGIAGVGTVLASNPAWEIVADRRRLAFRPPPSRIFPAEREAFELVEIDLPDLDSCKRRGVKTKGFALLFSRDGSDFGEVARVDLKGRENRTFIRRQCPVRYELSDVVFHWPNDPTRTGWALKPHYLVLVRFYRKGARGLEGRYMFVVTTLH